MYLSDQKSTASRMKKQEKAVMETETESMQWACKQRSIIRLISGYR